MIHAWLPGCHTAKAGRGPFCLFACLPWWLKHLAQWLACKKSSIHCAWTMKRCLNGDLCGAKGIPGRGNSLSKSPRRKMSSVFKTEWSPLCLDHRGWGGEGCRWGYREADSARCCRVFQHMLRPWTWPLGSWEAIKGFEAEGLFSCSSQETYSSTSSHATASVKLVFGPRVRSLHVHTPSAAMFNRVHCSHLLRSSCAFVVPCLPAWRQ